MSLASPAAARGLDTHGEDLAVSGLSKSYANGVPVLTDVNFTVPAGEFHALLGPSGSGKTTLLRVLAGFTPADSGQVTVGKRDVTHVPAEARNTGVVFQNYALFPHLTVSQNVAFGLRMRRQDRASLRQKVGSVLEMVGLVGYEKRRPAELSGGQQQRVALARALVIEPDLLLLDEPLSALDRQIRQSVRAELKRIQSETGLTTIIVTHDQEEALYLADRVFILQDGSIRQSGAPAELYRNPADSFVAGFVGELNHVRGRLRRQDGRCAVAFGASSLEVPAEAAGQLPSRAEVDVQVRPEDVLVEPIRHDTNEDEVGRIVDVEFSGPIVNLHVAMSDTRLQCLRLSPSVLDDPDLVAGHAVRVSLNPRGVRVLSITDEEVLG